MEDFNNRQDWDACSWASRFKGISENARKSNSDADRNALRTMRIDVFNHTLAVVRQGFYDVGNSHIKIDDGVTHDMISGTRFYDKEILLPSSMTHYDTKIDVVNEDCLIEAERLLGKGYKVAVLNMASRRNPGGGVISGAGAQEENIFRRTNIFQSLYQFATYAGTYGLQKSERQYPLDRNFGGIYSPNVLVFRGSESEGYPLLCEPFLVSVISVAAMNRPELTSDNKIIPSLIPPTKSKIRTILRIAIENGHDAIVLGAFGCGAFRNPPEHIAKLFKEVLSEEEFHNRFRHISFAILEDHNSRLSHNPDGNFMPFQVEFSDFSI